MILPVSFLFVPIHLRGLHQGDIWKGGLPAYKLSSQRALHTNYWRLVLGAVFGIGKTQGYSEAPLRMRRVWMRWTDLFVDHRACTTFTRCVTGVARLTSFVLLLCYGLRLWRRTSFTPPVALNLASVPTSLWGKGRSATEAGNRRRRLEQPTGRPSRDCSL